jgi:hypothetical protein
MTINTLVVYAASAALNAFLIVGASAQQAPVPNCSPVGGVIMTNFLTNTTTLGSATGDLKGAVNAVVISATGPQSNGMQTFVVRHTFVTESGDVIETKPSTALVLPIQPNTRVAVAGIYYERMDIDKGTGKFLGATGSMRVIGSANFATGETVFRYTGQVCTTAPAKVE